MTEAPDRGTGSEPFRKTDHRQGTQCGQSTLGSFRMAPIPYSHYQRLLSGGRAPMSRVNLFSSTQISCLRTECEARPTPRASVILYQGLLSGVLRVERWTSDQAEEAHELVDDSEEATKSRHDSQQQWREWAGVIFNGLGAKLLKLVLLFGVILVAVLIGVDIFIGAAQRRGLGR